MREGPGAAGWTPAQPLLLRAADELHADRRRSPTSSGASCAPLTTGPQLIELCMLIGHYEMLAMTLNALQVEPDPPGGQLPRPLRIRAAACRATARRDEPARWLTP